MGILAVGPGAPVEGQGNLKVFPSGCDLVPAGSGRLALSVSQKMMKAAGVRVGDLAKFEIEKR